MKRESRAYMHKDGFTFDSQGVGLSLTCVATKTNDFVMEIRGSYFHGGFPSLPLSLESASNRTSTVPANRLLPTFEILQIFCYPRRVCTSSLTVYAWILVKGRKKEKEKKRNDNTRESEWVSREKFPHKLLTPRNDQLFPPSTRCTTPRGAKKGRSSPCLSSFFRERKSKLRLGGNDSIAPLGGKCHSIRGRRILVACLERLLYRGVAMIKCLIEEGRLIAIVLVAKKRATSSPLTFPARRWASAWRGGKNLWDYRSSRGELPGKKLSHGEITMPITIFIAAHPWCWLRP